MRDFSQCIGNLFPQMVNCLDELDDIGPEVPSLCVPRVLSVPSDNRVRDLLSGIFGAASLANIVIRSREDPSSPEIKYFKIIVHFSAWPRSEKFDELRRRVLSGGSIKIIHEYPRYWRCFLNKAPKKPTKTGRGWLGGAVI